MPASALICTLTNALNSLKDNQDASQKVGARWDSLERREYCTGDRKLMYDLDLETNPYSTPAPSVSLFAQ